MPSRTRYFQKYLLRERSCLNGELWPEISQFVYGIFEQIEAI